MNIRSVYFLLGTVCITVAGVPLGAAWGQNSTTQAPEQFKPIGKVISVTGTATIEHTAAVVLQVNTQSDGKGQSKAGDLIYQGDVVQTGIDGTVGMVFTDGTSFTVSKNARMELNELIYDPKGNSNSTLFSLKKGTFTFIAGAIAKTGNMKVETPVGTMGIRGTAPHVEIMEDGTVKFSTLIEENKKEQQQAAAQPGQTPTSTRKEAGGKNQDTTLKELELCNGTNRTQADARIVACTSLVELRVDNPQALAMVYNNRASARASKGDYTGAIQDYDQSTKFDPAYATAFNNRGVAHKKTGDYDQAIKDFDTAITIAPDYAHAYANRAQVYEKKRDYARALSDIDEAIKLLPAAADLRNERCWIRAISGAVQEALPDCNEAIRLGPPSAAKFDSRGLTYLKSGQWASAISDFNAALRLNPRLASSLYGRGVAKAKNGDIAGGNADVAEATRVQQSIPDEFASYGVR
jgi:tetratricopeptide (TPR) repeat protein